MYSQRWGMRAWLVVTLIALGASHALAATCTVANPSSVTGPTYTLTSSIAVNGVTTVQTANCVDLYKASRLGLRWQCSSASGTPKVDIVWQESPDTNTANFIDDYVLSTDSVSEAILEAPILATPMQFGRAEIIGKATNPSDTVCVNISVFAPVP